MTSDAPHPVQAQGSAAARWSWWAPALLGALLYASTLGHGFCYDDEIEIVRNAHIQSWSHLPDMFSSSVWAGAGVETSLYRPLAIASYALNFSLSGLNPWSYHAFNLLLYALVCGLVARVALACGLSRLGALVAAGWFAVMPVHVESVANVVGRKQLMVAAALLAMCLAHRRATAGRPALASWGWTALAALAFAAAMLSKESGAVGLGLVVLFDLARGGANGGVQSAAAGPESRPDRGLRRVARVLRRGALAYAAYAVTLGAYLTLRTSVVGGFGMADIPFADNPAASAHTWVRMLTATAGLGHGAALQLLPARLSPDYAFDAFALATSPLDPRVLLALGLTAFALTLAWRERARSWLPLAALGWYAAAISPASNLLFPAGVIFAERLLFLPSVATCLAGGYLFDRLASGPRRDRVFWGAAALLTAYAIRTLIYTPEWSDDLRLRTYTVQVAPRSAKAHMGLAVPLYMARQADRAEQEALTALKIHPDFYLPHAFLGRIYRGAGRFAEAERHLLEAIRLGEGKKAEPYEDLAAIRQAQGRGEEARGLLRLVWGIRR